VKTPHRGHWKRFQTEPWVPGPGKYSDLKGDPKRSNSVGGRRLEPSGETVSVTVIHRPWPSVAKSILPFSKEEAMDRSSPMNVVGCRDEMKGEGRDFVSLREASAKASQGPRGILTSNCKGNP